MMPRVSPRICSRIWMAVYVFSLFVPIITAQPFETILAYRAHYHLPVDYKFEDDLGTPPADKFSLVQQTADLTLPVSVSTKHGQTLFIAGTFYNRFKFDGITNDETIETEYGNRITFKAGVSYPWNEKHRTTVIFLPTFSRQNNVFAGDAFQTGFLGVHSIAFSDRFTFKFGLYLNRDFWGVFWMPLAGVDWRLNNDWYIFGLLPGTSNIYKKVNDWFAFSISHRAPVGSILGAGGENYVGFGRGAYALFLFDLHFTPFDFDLMSNDADLTFSLSAGYSMFREYLLFDSADNQIQEGPFYPAKNGPYLKFMASVRLWP